MNYIFIYLIIYVYKPKFYLCIINHQYRPIDFSYHYIKFKTLDSALTFRYLWVCQQCVLSTALHHTSSVLPPSFETQYLLGAMADYVTGDFFSCHKYWPTQHYDYCHFYLYSICKFRSSIMWVKYHIYCITFPRILKCLFLMTSNTCNHELLPKEKKNDKSVFNFFCLFFPITSGDL